MNAGVFWYSSYDSLIDLVFNVSRFSPDGIIVFHGVNDRTICRTGDCRDHFKALPNDPKLLDRLPFFLSFLDGSEIFNLVRILINKRTTHFQKLIFDPNQRFKSWTDERLNFEHNLKMIRAIALEAGSRFVVFATQVNAGPSDEKLEPLNKITTRVAPVPAKRSYLFDTRKECTLLDSDFIAPSDCHFNAEGHKKFAACLYNFLKAKRILQAAYAAGDTR
ncbi:MAG: SGNH/GDSL hydrolase family protein [Deltaproteobacteria bacterium]|nr:SGNH/GDSL hydrolase family protein [Deltaproteobacteria bacterium]